MTRTSFAPAPSDDALPTKLLIGGDKVGAAGGETYEHIYPATGRVNAVVEMAGELDVDSAVNAASAAQLEWAAFSVERRRDLLVDLADLVRQNTDTLARLNIHDYAAPMMMSFGQVGLAERFLRYYAGFVDKAHGSSAPLPDSIDVNLIEREPYGVVGVIAPWNGPLTVIGLNVAPALAAGNAVVLKTSEMAPFAALRFGELCVEAGLPSGLVNVLPSGPEGGEALVRHTRVHKIHFTGGGHTARKILVAAASNLTPVATELGGKSANLVFDDANLDQAAQLCALQGPLVQSGQSCACGSRVLVQESVYDAFMEKFLAAVTSAPIGDPFEPDVLVGPVVSQNAVDRVLNVISTAVEDSTAKLVAGGNRMGGNLADGFYIEPTVFTNVDNDSPLARNETFGPVVSVMRFRDERDALAIANDTDYGLNAFIQTTNLARAHRVSRQLQAGSVWVNQLSDISPQSPYGGYKQSGNGRAGGLEGLREFQQTKNVRLGIS